MLDTINSATQYNVILPRFSGRMNLSTVDPHPLCF
jgi:hypothetical protein